MSAGVPGAFTEPFRTRNHRGLRPLATEPYSTWESSSSLERFIDSLSMDSSVDLCLHFIPERAAPSNPVRSNIVTYLTTANIDIAPGPFATNI